MHTTKIPVIWHPDSTVLWYHTHTCTVHSTNVIKYKWTSQVHDSTPSENTVDICIPSIPSLNSKNMILALKDVCCGTGATSNTVTCPNIHRVHFIIHNNDVGCGPKADQFLHGGSSHSDGVVVNWGASTVHWRVRVPLQYNTDIAASVLLDRGCQIHWRRWRTCRHARNIIMTRKLLAIDFKITML